MGWEWINSLLKIQCDFAGKGFAHHFDGLTNENRRQDKDADGHVILDMPLIARFAAVDARGAVFVRRRQPERSGLVAAAVAWRDGPNDSSGPDVATMMPTLPSAPPRPPLCGLVSPGWIVENDSGIPLEPMAWHMSSGKVSSGRDVEKCTSTAFRLRRNSRGENEAVMQTFPGRRRKPITA